MGSTEPSSAPSSAPSTSPSSGPSSMPSASPSSGPSSMPSETPSAFPSTSPSLSPSDSPSSGPTSSPSAEPSSDPSTSPSSEPSSAPSAVPSESPSSIPSESPSSIPSEYPSLTPTVVQSSEPSLSSAPSLCPRIENDFSELGAGTYVSDQLNGDYGVTVSASGKSTSGYTPDGAARVLGTGVSSVGNAIIIQSYSTSLPNWNENGGSMTVSFAQPVELQNIGVLRTLTVSADLDFSLEYADGTITTPDPHYEESRIGSSLNRKELKKSFTEST